MSTERNPYQPNQLSFLQPTDVELLHRLRALVSEAEQLYYPRGMRPRSEAPIIRTPSDLHEYFRPMMADLAQEQVRVANLTVRHQVLSCHMIYQGTLSASTVRVAEVFRPAVIENAAYIIVAHNHPSGDPEPSADDIRLTEQLVAAGKILDIRVLDHLVVARLGFVSLAERGLVRFHT